MSSLFEQIEQARTEGRLKWIACPQGKTGCLVLHWEILPERGPATEEPEYLLTEQQLKRGSDA